MNVITNLKSWDFNLGKYPLEKREADELITSFHRLHPEVVENYKCPECKNDVFSGINYCPWCGQRIVFSQKNTL